MQHAMGMIVSSYTMQYVLSPVFGRLSSVLYHVSQLHLCQLFDASLSFGNLATLNTTQQNFHHNYYIFH